MRYRFVELDETAYFDKRLEEEAIRKLAEVNRYIDKSAVLFGGCREAFSVGFRISREERSAIATADSPMWNSVMREDKVKKPVYYDREKEQFTAYRSRLFISERIGYSGRDVEDALYVPGFVSVASIEGWWDRQQKLCLKIGSEVQSIVDTCGEAIPAEKMILTIHEENPYLKWLDGVLYMACDAYIDEIIGLSMRDANELFLRYAEAGDLNYVKEYC